MRNKFIPAILLASAVSLPFVGTASADSVYVKNGLIFLADNGLFVSEEEKPDNQTKLFDIDGATDVTVSGCKAFVTTGAAGSKAVVVVDLFHEEIVEKDWCSDDADDDGQCEAEYDPIDKVLSIPCLKYQGKPYTAQMKPRGNSDNWFISFIEENDDEDDEDDEDDDDDYDD